ncbi:MAG TPA: cytochrome c [Pyrinomonadaceae bacterium]|nr:cytochrome c [Pyrinomonadaceae bacterium]
MRKVISTMTKLKAITGTVAFALVFGTLVVVSAGTMVQQSSDPAAYYKSKCLMCHGKKAEKKFDTALTDDQLVEIVLKGKKVEKPPHMPAYAEKGVTAEQAKALVEYMKQLKATP